MKRLLPFLLLTSAPALFGAANDTLIDGISSSGGRKTTVLADPGATRFLQWNDSTNVPAWANMATTPIIDASAFSGNLSTSDDTIQELAQAVNDLTGSGALSNIVEDTTPQLGGTLDVNSQNISVGGATISPTEFSYIDGLTSNAQSQLSLKISSTLTNAASLGFYVDEDTMASDSATKFPSQQSVKAYVDALASAVTAGFPSLSGAYDDPSWIIGLDVDKVDFTNQPFLGVLGQLADYDALVADSDFKTALGGSDQSITAVWDFTAIPRTALTALASGTEMAIESGYTRDFDGTETTLTFAGTPADGSIVFLVGDFSANTLIHFPSSVIQNDQTTTTDLNVTTGVHTFIWRYEGGNTRWLLTHTVPSHIRNATKVATGAYTIGTDDEGELYGGIIYVTSAATLTIPAVASGAHFHVITIGATAVSVDPNASDLIYLDGTALDDGDKITNASTTGDDAEFWYFDSTGWYAKTNSWSDGGP